MMLPGDDARRAASALPPDAFERWTVDPAKAELYRTDPYAREGYCLLAGDDARQWLWDSTFVVLKPDAVAGRRCGLILDVLADRGWVPIAACPVTFDPLLTREIWRYQFNAASWQRIAVVDHLLGSAPSLVVLLRDVSASSGLPASVRLTAAKGKADLEAAGSGDLRTRFGRVNGLFNFVHTADEPADLIRELRLFGYRTGTDWLVAALRGSRDPAMLTQCPARTWLPELERLVPEHDLDLAASLRRLSSRADSWGELARTRAQRADVGRWLDVLQTAPLPPGPSRWDVLTVVTGWIECNEPNVDPVLATPPARAWLNRLAPHGD